MARTSKAPEISEEELQQLTLWSRSQKVESRYKVRANIILDWLAGKTFKESSAVQGISEVAINKWRSRYRSLGLAGLRDAARSGKPPVISEAQRNQVVHLACSKPEDGRNRYSQEQIAAQVGISSSMVSEILRAQKLQPHKTAYWCGKSPDPDFEAKMLNIVGLYLNPPEQALVLSVDEKTQIQALDRTQAELPMKPGISRRLTNTYKRNGTVNLIAALAVHQGEITARSIDRNTAENFLKFLKMLDRKYRNVTLHIIVDNLSTHKNKEVQAWLASKRKFKIHYTPTYASWLNQIEIWFSILTRDVIKDGIWHSKQELIDQIMTYIKTYNKEQAKPFHWSYSGNN